MNQTSSTRLEESPLFKYCQADLLDRTRLHRIPNLGQPQTPVWVKREDEAGFGISGCKKRKYASLIPYIQQQGYEEVLMIGGAHSNHVVGFLQLILEKGWKPHLLLKQAHGAQNKGNGFLRNLLFPSDRVIWLTSRDWKRVHEIATIYAQQQVGRVFVLPEGGNHPAAFPGAATLAWDILRNETEAGFKFDHIFIDAGSGFMAASLFLGLQWLQHPAKVHILLTAGTEQSTSELIHDLHPYAKDILQEFDLMGEPQFHEPTTARAFGSINATIKQEVVHIARTHGILADPIYTAKLFYAVRKQIESGDITGKVLVIHSGGGTGLMGFDGNFLDI
ncbi:MAG: pyridoxal-phosphate dependent enzyme [Bacteroidota bacterium]